MTATANPRDGHPKILLGLFPATEGTPMFTRIHHPFLGFRIEYELESNLWRAAEIPTDHYPSLPELRDSLQARVDSADRTRTRSIIVVGSEFLSFTTGMLMWRVESQDDLIHVEQLVLETGNKIFRIVPADLVFDDTPETREQISFIVDELRRLQQESKRLTDLAMALPVIDLATVQTRTEALLKDP
jgi:hypothetical protein